MAEQKPVEQKPAEEAVQLGITINLDQMTIGDLELMDNLSSKDARPRDLVDFLARVVVGADVRKLPMKALWPILDAVNSEIMAAADPKN
jgi:hypothetical protein